MLEIDVKFRANQFNLSAQLTIDAPITALFGPAGAGKSTLLHMISGDMNAQQGWIKFGGETLFDSRLGIRLPARQRRVGLVSDDPAAYPPCPVQAHLRNAYRQRPKDADPALGFEAMLDFLELRPLLDKHAQKLSIPDKRRVALAHALMTAPRLLLIDAAGTASGPAFADDYLALLNRVGAALNIPIIYVPRTLEEALRLTRRMVFMAQGEILGAGDIADIVNERILLAGPPRSIESSLPVTIAEHDARHGCTLAHYYGTELVLPIAPDLAKGESTLVSIRSNDIALSKQRLDGISIQNQIKGRICAIIKTTEYAMVQVDCGTALLVAVSLRALDDMGLREGDTVYCLAKAQAFAYADRKQRSNAQRFSVPNHGAIH